MLTLPMFLFIAGYGVMAVLVATLIATLNHRDTGLLEFCLGMLWPLLFVVLFLAWIIIRTVEPFKFWLQKKFPPTE